MFCIIKRNRLIRGRQTDTASKSPEISENLLGGGERRTELERKAAEGFGVNT